MAEKAQSVARDDAKPRYHLLLALLALLPGSASAEAGYNLTLASDDRFRGQSTSDGLPVATASVSYDDRSGLYAGGSLTIAPTRTDGVQLLRSVQYVGYAYRLRPGVAIDVGITNRFYGQFATVEYARRFTQGYIGVTGHGFSSHLYYSPNYDGRSRSATYAEVDGELFRRGDWSLSSHVGVLAPPARYRRPLQRLEIDGRLGVTRRFGRSAVSATLVSGGPRDDARDWRGTLVLAVSRSL